MKYDVVIIDINGSAPFENSPPKCIYSNPNLLKICDMLLVNYVNRYDMEFQPIFPYMKVVQIKDYYNEMVIQAKHSIDSILNRKMNTSSIDCPSNYNEALLKKE